MPQSDSIPPVNFGLMGAWDLDVEDLSLGGMLDIVVQLTTMRPADDKFGVCFISENSHPLRVGMSTEQFRSDGSFSKVQVPDSGLLNALSKFDCSFEIFHTSSFTDLRNAAERFGFETWPNPPTEIGKLDHEHQSTLSFQNLINQKHEMRRPNLNSTLVQQVDEFIEIAASGRFPVAIHVKNDPKHQGGPNGSLDVWRQFIEQESQSDRYTFIVVGNDDFSSLKEIDNVVLTQDTGNDLARDLAIIQRAPCFMGEAAGPAHMAILGEKPYSIFKPLEIHKETMDLQLQGNPNYPFSTPGQQLRRMDPEISMLSKELHRLVATNYR
jgi:hypothetical protein